MYLSNGSGIHCLNNQAKEYSGDTVLFLTPEDSHDFQIVDQTRFCVIKFLPIALKEGLNQCSTDYWDNLLVNLSRKWNSSNFTSLKQESLRGVISLFELIIAQWDIDNHVTNEIHINLLRSLLLVMEKGSNGFLPSGSRFFGLTKVERIQNYIHSNINFPERLTLKQLSVSHELSQSTLRGIFLKDMGISIGRYINSVKIEAIKNRMNIGGLMLSEIALEFGFADSSHFNKFFKIHTGGSPSEFKAKLHQNNLARRDHL